MDSKVRSGSYRYGHLNHLASGGSRIAPSSHGGQRPGVDASAALRAADRPQREVDRGLVAYPLPL